MNDALRRARAMLRDVTPLRSDCGLCCGHRCCASAEAELQPGGSSAVLPDFSVAACGAGGRRKSGC